MIKKYKKRVNYVRAVQFKGDNIKECREFAGESHYLKNDLDIYVFARIDRSTKELVKVEIDDYLYYDENNVFHVSQKSQFESTYKEYTK